MAIAPFDEEREAWVIESPEGEVRVLIDQWPYVSVRETIVCDSSSEPHVLRLVEATRVTVRFFDGETPLAFPQDWDPGLIEQHGSGFTMCRQKTPLEKRYMFTRTGTYTLALPTLEGYAPKEPLSFEVKEGELTDIVVPYETL